MENNILNPVRNEHLLKESLDELVLTLRCEEGAHSWADTVDLVIFFHGKELASELVERAVQIVNKRESE